MVLQSRLIILDEPTAALSPEDTDRLFDVLSQLTEDGTAVVYISHRLDEVRRLAQTVTILKDGVQVVTEPADGLTMDRMVALMVGREIEDLFPPRSDNADGPMALEVTGLVDPPAVLSADLQVRVGEILGVYGLEGHGQDELLACIAGVRTPVSGTLRLGGERHPWRSVAGMIRQGVGFVPEDRKTEGLIPDMTGRRNITLPILPALSQSGVVSVTREVSVAGNAAAAAGVQGNLNTSVSSLSGGNQQKLVLARWIAAHSSVLLLNQPTRGVDVGSKAEIYRLIRRTCSERGAAALVVSREIPELQGMCDRIVVMSHGHLVAEHAPTASEETILGSAVKSRTA
jgi:ABC-type sugar transport system ATPase subunit